jgi:hypothetical protein
MTDRLPIPNSDEIAGPGPDHLTSTAYPGTPRWVKVFGIIALVLILLLVVAMVASGGGHGPARHLPSGGASVHTPPVAHGVQWPSL